MDPRLERQQLGIAARLLYGRPRLLEFAALDSVGGQNRDALAFQYVAHDVRISPPKSGQTSRRLPRPPVGYALPSQHRSGRWPPCPRQTLDTKSAISCRPTTPRRAE